MEGIVIASIVAQAARDYDIEIDVVLRIYKECQGNGIDFYEALESYIKNRANS